MFSVFSFLVNLRICEYPQQNQIRYMKEIISFGSINPLLAASLALVLFSIGVQSSAYSLVIFSIIMSSIACFYYIRIIQSLYFLKLRK